MHHRTPMVLKHHKMNNRVYKNIQNAKLAGYKPYAPTATALPYTYSTPYPMLAFIYSTIYIIATTDMFLCSYSPYPCNSNPMSTVYTRVTRRPLLPGHVLFSRPRKCVRQGFQNCPGFCLVGYRSEE